MAKKQTKKKNTPNPGGIESPSDPGRKEYDAAKAAYSPTKSDPDPRQIGELKFIRIYDFHLIPRDLIEQIKDRDYPSDRLYAIGEYITKNPCTLLYALADPEHKIKGILWATVSLLDERMYVNLLSIAKEYQNHGQALKVVHENLEKIQTNLKLKGIRWITTRPHAFERQGFKRAQSVMMEV